MSGSLSTKLRLVRCPRCEQVLPEPTNVPKYKCGGCNTVLRAKMRKNDTPDTGSHLHETDAAKRNKLEHVSDEQIAQSASQEETCASTGELRNEEKSRETNFSDEVASSYELNHHESEEPSPLAGVYSEVDDSQNCLEQSNGRNQTEFGDHKGEGPRNTKFSDEFPSYTELTCQEIEDSPPVDGTSTELDGNFKSRFIIGCLSEENLQDSTITAQRPSSESISMESQMSPHCELLKQSQERTLSGFDHIISEDTLEDFALSEQSPEFSLQFKDLPKYPTSGSDSAYDGSVSSYDGTDISSNNGRSVLQSSTSFDLPSKPRYPEEEKMKLLKMVYELQDQLNRTNILRSTAEEIFPRVTEMEKQIPSYYGHVVPEVGIRHDLDNTIHPGSHNQGRNIPFSAEPTVSRHQVDCSCFDGYPQDCNCLAPLPSQIRCNDSQYTALPKQKYFNNPSTSSSPQHYTGSEFSLRRHDAMSNEYRHAYHYEGTYEGKMSSRERHQPVKRHVLPLAGGAPFLVCYKCSELLQLPADFLLFGKRCHRLRCSACSVILKFSLQNGSHILPPNSLAPSPSNNVEAMSCSDDCGPSLSRSCSTEEFFRNLKIPMEPVRSTAPWTDFDAADNSAHLGGACQSGPVVSLSGNENRGEASIRECITERILGLEDLQQNSGGRRDNAAKSFGVMTEKENKYDNKRVKMMERFMRRNRETNEENKEVAVVKAKYLKDWLENTPPLNFVGKETKEEKPLVEFDSANIKEYQSGLLEKTNSRKESKRPSTTEKVLGSVDSTTRISSTDFDAADNTAHLGGACQSGPVVPLSGNENRGEASKRECITERILGLEDLQQNSGGRRDNAAESFGAIYDPGIHTTHSLAQNSIEVLEALPTLKQPNDCVPLLSLGRLKLEGCVQEEKSQDLPRLVKINGVEQRVTKSPSYLGGFTAQSTSSSRWPISLPDGRHIVVLNRLEKSTKNVHVARAPSVSLPEKMVRRTVKKKCRIMRVIYAIHQQHFGKRCEGTAKSFRAMHICRNRGINWVFTVKRIHKQHGNNQWPFRQKWATRKGYSLGEKRPYEVSSQSMDEKLVSKFLFIHMSQFPTFSPLPLALPNSSEIVGPIALSSDEFAATNNRAHLVRQNQCGSTASHYERKNTRETLGRQRITESLSSIEDLQQHFARKHKDAVKRLGVKVSIFKSSCRQHRVFWLPCQIIKSEQQAFDATSNIAHVVKADQGIPTVSCSEMENKQESLKRECSGLSLEDLREHYGGRREDAMKGLGEKKMVRRTLKRKYRIMSLIFSIHQQHFGKRSESTAKSFHAMRICRNHGINCVSMVKCIHKQHGINQWPFRQKWATRKGHSLGEKRPYEVSTLSMDMPRSLKLDCSRGLGAQFAVGLPDGGYVLSVSEKKIVEKTLKRKCKTMSLFSLEDDQQHGVRRWGDAAKSLGRKRICRQLVVQHVSRAKRIHRQHVFHRWPFQQSAVGLPDGGYVLSVGKTLKRKCKTMSLFSLEDDQQHGVKRWGDDAKSLGRKRVCRQLVVQNVSIAKRIRRQHVFHRWPFQQVTHLYFHFYQNWETMKAYSVRDKRPAEVLSLSTDGKLVSRLQLVHISWLVKFLPRPSAYRGGGEIVGPIALLSSEFAATNNRAHGIRNDQSGSSSASHFEEEIPGEPVDVEGTGSGISLEELQQLFDKKREDAAKSLKVSVSTFKRICRQHGIKPWPYQARKKAVKKPPDRHRGMNTTGSSDDRRNLSASQEEPLLRGHVSGPIYRTIPTCTDPAPGQPTPIVPHPTGNLLASEEEVLLRGHVSGPIYGRISSCTDPAPSQTTPIVPHPVGNLEDQRNLLALPEELLLSQRTPSIPPAMDGFAYWGDGSALFDDFFPEGHASGSLDCAAPACSNPAPSQTMPTNATEMQNMDFVELKATYDDATFGNTTIKFQLPPKFETSELEEKLSKILKCELDSFRVEYKDKDDEWILMGCDENVREYLQLLSSLGNQVTKLKITKVPNTTNLCETCGSSLTRKRPRHV